MKRVFSCFRPEISSTIYYSLFDLFWLKILVFLCVCGFQWVLDSKQANVQHNLRATRDGGEDSGPADASRERERKIHQLLDSSQNLDCLGHRLAPQRPLVRPTGHFSLVFFLSLPCLVHQVNSPIVHLLSVSPRARHCTPPKLTGSATGRRTELASLSPTPWKCTQRALGSRLSRSPSFVPS